MSLSIAHRVRWCACVASACLVWNGAAVARTDGPTARPSLAIAVGSPDGTVSAHVEAPQRALSAGPFDLGWMSEATALGPPGGRSRGLRLSGGPRVAFAWPGGGAWLGAGLERRLHAEGRPTASVLELGARCRMGGLAVSGRARHTTFAVPQSPIAIWSWTAPPEFHSPPEVIPTLPIWEARPPRLSGVTSLEAGASLRIRCWQFEAGSGIAVGDGIAPIRLARLEAMRWLDSRWGFGLEVRSGAPKWLSDDFVEAPRAELSLRLEPGRATSGPAPSDHRVPGAVRWSVLRLGGGVYSLGLHASGVRRVALRGDFSDWQPVLLRRAGIGWWETTQPMTPGLHQVEVSLDDGPWQPPPGLPTSAGLYGEVVGSFIAN
ncbi:MAG TPA: hypothetical protein VGK93_07335 [Candidatus Eisenbacteria bacterium]|jgi:hypothetical protein